MFWTLSVVSRSFFFSAEVLVFRGQFSFIRSMSVNVTDLEPFIKLFNQFNEIAWNASDVAFEALYAQAASMMEKNRPDSLLSFSPDKLSVWRHRDNLHWIIVSVILHALIFLFGLITNGILVYVAWKAKFLRIPAYCYLVSLAGADFLVLCTALPMEMISHFTDRMSFNQAGCAALAGLSFVGINVGSLSVLTFTVELNIAVCQPILPYRLCPKLRTKTVICYSWLVVFVYCITWLSFTNIADFFTQSSGRLRPSSECSLFMPLNAYLTFFITDFVLFYCIPLMAAVGVYVRLFTATKKNHNPVIAPAVVVERKMMVSTKSFIHKTWIKRRRGKAEAMRRASQQDLRRNSMLRLLLVIILICGLAWLPFRLIPAYKTFWAHSLLDTWFLFFSSTLIYMKCAGNPLLYILLSSKFRTAVRLYCFRHRQHS